MQRIKLRLGLLIILMALPLQVLSAGEEGEGIITHVVVCWLNADITDNELENVIEETRKLQSIPGLLELHVGTSIGSDRVIVDDSFTFAVSMKFNSVEDMKAYLTHEKHVAFVNNVLKPKLDKIVVYDF